MQGTSSRLQHVTVTEMFNLPVLYPFVVKRSKNKSCLQRSAHAAACKQKSQNKKTWR